MVVYVVFILFYKMYGLGCVRSDSFAGLVCYRSASHFGGGCRKNATKMFSEIFVFKSSAKVRKKNDMCKSIYKKIYEPA